MRKQNLFKSLIPIVCLISGAVCIALSKPVSSAKVSSRETLLVPPEHFQHFTLGYYESASDVLWLRLLQDIDLCAPGVRALVTHSKAEVEKANQERQQLGKAEPRCRDGWSYRMLDAITTMSPKFFGPYLYGAPALSILSDDRSGAAKIYDRGLKYFPNNKELLMNASYHFLIEVGDGAKAAELLTRAGHNGAPEWVFSLAGRLYTEAGKAELAKASLTQALDNLGGPDAEGPFADRLRERIKAADEILSKSELSR